jgi:hypothetical protein
MISWWIVEESGPTQFYHTQFGLLTRQVDKLVAIAGVARLMQQVNESKYLAGLWRDNLEWQLLWSANSEPREWQAKSNTKMMSSPYRAPS